MPKLFSYKMTHDTGFGPNPFWGVLTLATCKPRIRSAKTKNKGDWIAGFTSQALCGDAVGKERLVYLMQIEGKIAFADYFADPRFKCKIPKLGESQCIYRAGDNIYRPTCSDPSDYGDFEQLCNSYHCGTEKAKDLSGKFVLVSRKFFYFGKEAIVIPSNVRPDVPLGQSAHGVQTHDQNRAQNFINYIVNNWQTGVHGEPHSWPKGDSSWKE